MVGDGNYHGTLKYTVVLRNDPCLHRVLHMVLQEYHGLTFVQWGPKD